MRLPVGPAFRAAITALAALAGVSSFPASAQNYPNHPIRLVVPWPAGGSADASARILALQLGERLKQPIVVDNRAGANGRIGTDMAAKAAPDGYTLVLAGAETHAINPSLYPTLPYNPGRDFAMVAPFAINPFALVIRGDIKATNLRDLVAAAKAAPGKMTAASWGVGSTSQLALEMIKTQAGIDILHVPYPGESAMVTALMGGQVDLMVVSAIRAAQLRKDDRVRVLGVTTKNRVSFMSDVPTLNEQGYNVDVANWIGIGAPAKTPPEIVQKLASEINAVLQTPSFSEGLLGLGMTAHPVMSSPQFQKFMQDDAGRWGKVIQAAKIQID